MTDERAKAIADELRIWVESCDPVSDRDRLLLKLYDDIQTLKAQQRDPVRTTP